MAFESDRVKRGRSTFRYVENNKMENIEKLQLFKKIATEFLESHPQLKYEWKEQDQGNIWGLSIFKIEENGFDVWLGFDGHDIYFSAGHVHHSEFWLNEKEPLESEIRKFLGFIRDLLSNKMRIIEKYAGKIAYKVLVQAWDGQKWKTEDTFGLLFFNYLGKRSEKIYQNNILEGYNTINT